MADFGLEIYNAAGQKTLSVTDSITRVIDVFTISPAAASGSKAYDNLPSGRTWVYYFNPLGGNYVPSVSVSGNSIVWSYSRSTRIGVTVYVGAY